MHSLRFQPSNNVGSHWENIAIATKSDCTSTRDVVPYALPSLLVCAATKKEWATASSRDHYAWVWRQYLIAASTHSHVLVVLTMDIAWYANTLAIQAIGGIPTITFDNVQMWTRPGAWKKKTQYMELYVRSKGYYIGTRPWAWTWVFIYPLFFKHCIIDDPKDSTGSGFLARINFG